MEWSNKFTAENEKLKLSFEALLFVWILSEPAPFSTVNLFVLSLISDLYFYFRH